MKITRIETITFGGRKPLAELIFLRVHTDEGLVGHGETYYVPTAVREFIHNFAAPMILGEDPFQIERLWQRLYDLCARFGAKGAEMRGISAIDVALWDILGQVAGLPVYQLLGGASHDRVKVYNTCAGASYARAELPGLGHRDMTDPLDDYVAFMTDAGELAVELMKDGFRAMKIWPFDVIAIRSGGMTISNQELNEGAEPLRKIREAVGEQMEVMIEGHGYWSLPAAIRIGRALEDLRPAWLEDLVLADDIDALVELRRATTIPILASEYLSSRWDYRRLFEKRAADIAMVDPTWCGGISEARRIADLAASFSMPVAMHDCTGPFTLLAGIHVAFYAPNTIYQEVVRAFLHRIYGEFVTALPRIEEGHVLPPEASGIGAALQPEVLRSKFTDVVVSKL